MNNTLLRTPQQADNHMRRDTIQMSSQRDARTVDKPRTDARPLAAAASMPNLSNSNTHLRNLSGTAAVPTPPPTEGLALSGITPITQPMSVSPGVPLKSLATPTMSIGNNPPKSSASTGRSTPGPTTTPEYDAGQRRIEAVRRLQTEDLSDDDLMIILPDFEQNNAVVEMYLGLHRDQLRLRWLSDKILARRRAGPVDTIRRAEEDHYGNGMQ